MRVLIAPNPFKGTLSAAQAARAIASALKKKQPHLSFDFIPLADGGPGTLSALQAALGGRLMRVRVKGPLGRPLWASWLRLGSRLAVIESAQAIGLERLAPPRRHAVNAGSQGLGQLILAAKRAGCNELLIGLGGSACTDAGIGMALALGSAAATKGLQIKVLCDVDNPLYGPHGAARVFGPQKGASKSQVRLLEARLRAAAKLMPASTARMKGAGAAGGLGAGLVAFAGATLVPGAATLMKLCKFRQRMKRADWVVSGEGSFDSQSLRGKLPVVVAREAVKAGKRCSLVCGKIQDNLRLKGVELIELKSLA